MISPARKEMNNTLIHLSVDSMAKKPLTNLKSNTPPVSLTKYHYECLQNWLLFLFCQLV